MATTEDKVWIHETCLAWRGEDPAALLEALMSDERCAAFGPVHHFLVGASLLACAWQTVHHDGAGLSEALAELDSRAACVPGATCAKWGVCGAAASCGMAFAVLAGNAPLRREGWSEGQLMVSEILGAIAGRDRLVVASEIRASPFARPSHGLTTILGCVSRSVSRCRSAPWRR